MTARFAAIFWPSFFGRHFLAVLAKSPLTERM
jgi:hypothetical protein